MIRPNNVFTKVFVIVQALIVNYCLWWRLCLKLKVFDTYSGMT